jgi:hypothetical protein
MVRNTIARQSDVDAASIKYEVEPGKGSYRNGAIDFAAKKGQSVDLRALSQSLSKTRLGKGTSSGVNYLEITATGEALRKDKDVLFKVSGSAEQFRLGEDPKAKPKEGVKPAYERLQEALASGAKITSVTGRVAGWNGKWPAVLKELSAVPADKEMVLLVTEFEMMKK